MKRRALLLAAATLLGDRILRRERVFAASKMGMKMDIGDPNSRIQNLPEGAPLPSLVGLANTSEAAGQFVATLEAGVSKHGFVPGVASSVLAYNGALPGPLIELTESDHVKIAFKNGIPEQPSTIHWHGLEIPADQDGNPSDPVASDSSRI